MPECLVCGTELDFDDTIDEYADDTTVRMKELGHCPKCGKHHKWFDVYKYSHFEDLEGD